MFRRKIIKLIETQGVLEKCDIDILNYGLEQLAAYLISALIVFALGAIMHVGIGGVVFFLVFIPLRLYAGGYHADTRTRCGVISTCLLIITYWFLKQFDWTDNIWILVEVISVVLILWLAPVDNSNRRLGADERKKYKGKTDIIALGILVVFFILFPKSSLLTGPIVMACVLVSITLISGQIKNIHRAYSDNKKEG